MLAESGTRVVAPAAALADAGVGAAAQPEREQVRDEVRRTVQEAMEAAREGAANAAQGSREAGRLEAELARARDAVRQAQGQGGVSILRDESGRVVVNTADGRTIVIDPRAVASEEAQHEIIQQALVPHPSPPPFDRGPPDGVLALIGIIFGCLTVMVVGWPLARAFGRRVERNPAAPGVSPDVAARLERIEQAVDAVAIEVERMAEAQRYSARLLTERLPDAVPQLSAQGAERAPANRT